MSDYSNVRTWSLFVLKNMIAEILRKDRHRKDNSTSESVNAYLKGSESSLPLNEERIVLQGRYLSSLNNRMLLEGRHLLTLKKRRYWLTGSITVEASIALPIIIFTLYILMFPIKIMEAERRVLNDMESSAKTACMAEYVQNTAEEYINTSETVKSAITGLIDGFESGALAAGAVYSAHEQKIFHNIYLSPETAVLSNDKDADPAMIFIELNYEPDMPFGLFKLLPIRKSIVTNRRAWVGSKGGRGRSKYSDDSGEEGDALEDDDEIVYLGKTSTEVYHVDSRCHYLSNDMKTGRAENMGNLRNASGGRYHACPSCKPGKNGTVYYTASGTAYHSSESCKAICAYARAVNKSECDGMRPCSYCGKKAREN